MRHDDPMLDDLADNHPEAWRRLVDSERSWLLAAARRMTRDHASAEDLVQEVFLVLHRQIREGRLMHLGNIQSWLRRLLQYQFSDRVLRKELGSRRKGPAVLAKSEPPERPDPRPLPDQVAVEDELRQQVQTAIFRLPDPLRHELIRRRLVPGAVDGADSRRGRPGRYRQALAMLRQQLAADRR